MKKLKIGLLASLLLLLLIFISCSKDDSPVQVTGEGVFTTTAGTASIEGELFLPDGNGPFPSMIIIPGSGNETRQELEVFASILNQNDYALYIYDKRGIGGSTGSYPTESLENTDFLEARAEDVLGILSFLESHSQIDNSRIGIYGSSQGAWVNSLVHQSYSNLAYIVMVSGGVASNGLENFYCSLTDDPLITIDEALNQLSDYEGPSGFDPLAIVSSMELPVLWIYGNEDRSHPARYDIQVLEGLNKANFELQIYENVDHELVDLSTGQPPADLFDNLGMWLVQNN